MPAETNREKAERIIAARPEIGGVVILQPADDELPPTVGVTLRAADILPDVLAAMLQNQEFVNFSGSATGRGRFRLERAPRRRIGR